MKISSNITVRETFEKNDFSKLFKNFIITATEQDID